MIILFYLLNIANCCTITGQLYTPKLYPANNVRVEYSSVSTMSNEKGEFKIEINSDSLHGLLTFNIANQFQMSRLLSSDTCPLQLNNIVLDNHQLEETNIYGCIIKGDSNEIVANTKLNIVYDQPTLLDIQELQSNDKGCFFASDKLMKLMIYRATVSIFLRGYIEKKIEIPLFDTFIYDLQVISLEPNYYLVNLLINVEPQSQVSLSCGTQFKYQFISKEKQTHLLLDQVFKDSYQYTCGILAQNQKMEVDYFVFTVTESVNITIDFNLHPFQNKESIIIGQVVNEKLDGFANCQIVLSYLQNSVAVQTDRNGNYTFYPNIDNQTEFTLYFSYIGYIDQQIKFISPNPPFTYYVQQMQMLPVTSEIQYTFTINGIMLTKFNDPIVKSEIGLYKQETLIKKTLSDEDGKFNLEATFKLAGEGLSLKANNPQFIKYNSQYLVASNQFNHKQQCSITEDDQENKSVQCLNQQIIMTPQNISIIILATFEKKIDGSIFYWLDKAYYDVTHYANPSLNNTLEISNKSQLKQQQSFQSTIQVYDYYIYSIGIFIESGGLSNTLIKDSSENGKIDFGVVTLYNQTEQSYSKYYTQFNGKVIEMIDPSCQQQIQIPIEDAQIEFSLSFIQSSQFINKTSTNTDGLFYLTAYNPLINGQFNGVFQISKNGFLSNEVDITYVTDNNNQEFSIGTIQLINMNGLKGC